MILRVNDSQIVRIESVFRNLYPATSSATGMQATDVITSDLTVVGGGMAGTCAAVAAARLGLEVALVNDRPVLGGNASSEVRVWVNGATGGRHNRYAREGGLMEEILLENKARNPDGNADIWDTVLIDLVRDEPTLDLFLNTLVDEIETDGEEITAVAGSQLMSERRFRFESPWFVDATGDGVLAERAGAPWRMGREAADEYGELAAPDEADERTLGSSIMFYTKRVDEPVPYTPPDFAHDFTEDPPEVLARRADPDDQRCLYWWIEYGGEADLDPIRDNEEIRDELWAMVYGAWDYIKNSGAFDAAEVADLQLEWAGKIPGKRESRRILGEYVTTEHDLVDQRRFEDTVGHGGWSIDLHPPAGFYDDQGRGSEHWHLDGPYAIPYRCLVPQDVDNLLLAGRHVSATHVAFGSIRVQMTLATLGQAAGTAAALCRADDVTPRGLVDEGIDQLQQLLLREDQWVIDVPNEDPDDLARSATVSASSHDPLAVTTADERHALSDELGIYVPTDEPIETLTLWLGADEPTDLAVTVHDVGKPENYVPGRERRTLHIDVPLGEPAPVELPVDTDPGDGRGLFLILEAAPAVSIAARSGTQPGLLAGWRRETGGNRLAGGGRDDAWPTTSWVPRMAIDPEPRAYEPAAVVDGYARPFGMPHCWRASAQEAEAIDEHVTLEWDEPVEIASVQCTFNSRLTPWYNALVPTDEPRVERCVRDYRIEARIDGAWTTVADASGNYQRFRRHSFDAVTTDAIRLVVEATNGLAAAEVFELRAYGPQVDPLPGV